MPMYLRKYWLDMRLVRKFWKTKSKQQSNQNDGHFQSIQKCRVKTSLPICNDSNESFHELREILENIEIWWKQPKNGILIFASSKIALHNFHVQLLRSVVLQKLNPWPYVLCFSRSSMQIHASRVFSQTHHHTQGKQHNHKQTVMTITQ